MRTLRIKSVNNRSSFARTAIPKKNGKNYDEKKWKKKKEVNAKGNIN